MLWRIAPLETPGRVSGLGGVERLVERCRFAGVGIVSLPGRRMPAFVEKVHQHDPFGFRDVDIGEIAQDKGVIDSRAAVFHRHLPPPFEGRANSMKRLAILARSYHCERGHPSFSISRDDMRETALNYLSGLEYDDAYFVILKDVLLRKLRERQAQAEQQVCSTLNV